VRVKAEGRKGGGMSPWESHAGGGVGGPRLDDQERKGSEVANQEGRSRTAEGSRGEKIRQSKMIGRRNEPRHRGDLEPIFL